MDDDLKQHYCLGDKIDFFGQFRLSNALDDHIEKQAQRLMDIHGYDYVTARSVARKNL